MSLKAAATPVYQEFLDEITKMMAQQEAYTQSVLAFCAEAELMDKVQAFPFPAMGLGVGWGCEGLGGTIATQQTHYLGEVGGWGAEQDVLHMGLGGWGL